MIKERIIQLIEYKKLTKETFFDKIGMTSANFRGNAKKTPVNSQAIENIFSEIPEVNLEWLITGRGNMFDAGPNHIFPLKTDRLLDKQLIPVYDITATMGLMPLFANINQAVPIDYMELPNLPKCDGALYAYGDSMLPLFKAGDIIAFKRVADIENNIFFGEIYLMSIEMEDEEFITIKYIHKSEKEGYIKLASENSEHTSTDVPISRIRALALVKASVRYHTLR